MVALDPGLSLLVLAALGLFIAVTVVRSMVKVATRVLVVGVLVAVLLGAGVLQLPDAAPGLDDTFDVVEPTVTGMIGVNATNITEEGSSWKDYIRDRVEHWYMDTERTEPE